MKCLGLDPSATSTGLVLLEGDEVLVNSRLRLPKLKGMERAAEQARQLIRTLQEHGWPDVAAVETPFVGRNPKVHAQLVEVGTLLRFPLWSEGVPTCLVKPSQLKEFLGASSKGKVSVGEKVRDIYGFEHKSDDIVDAYALARIAQASKSHSLCKDPKMREVVARLEWLR